MTRMLRRLAAPALLLLLAPRIGAQDDPKPELAGRWQFTVVYEGGSGSPIVSMTQKGDTLAVRYSSNAFGDIDGEGQVTKDGFEFWVTTSAGGDPFTMTFSGAFEGKDGLKGTVDLGGNGSATFTARRLPKTPGPGAGRH